MKFSTKLSPGRHSGYKIHHKIDPVDHAWREGATPKKYLNHAFLRSREAWLARGQNIPQLFVLALSRSMVGARPKNTSITRSCAPAKRGWREAKQIPQLFVLAPPRSAGGARPTNTTITRFCAPAKRARRKAKQICQLLVLALPRSVVGVRPNNLSIIRCCAPAERG